MDTKQIIAVFGTEEEQAAVRKLKNDAAGTENLSMSDFILRHILGIRKAPEAEKKSL